MRKHDTWLGHIGSRIRGHLGKAVGPDLDAVKADCEMHSQNCRGPSSQQIKLILGTLTR